MSYEKGFSAKSPMNCKIARIRICRNPSVASTKVNLSTASLGVTASYQVIVSSNTGLYLGFTAQSKTEGKAIKALKRLNKYSRAMPILT